GSLGLLGDKVLDLSVGSTEEPKVPPNGWVASEPPADVNRLLTLATEAANHANQILARVDEASRTLGEPGTLEDIGAITPSLRRAAVRVDQGPGTLHDLVYGERLSGQLNETLVQVGGAARETRRVLGSIKLTGAAAEVLINASLDFQHVSELSESIDTAAL